MIQRLDAIDIESLEDCRPVYEKLRAILQNYNFDPCNDPYDVLGGLVVIEDTVAYGLQQIKSGIAHIEQTEADDLRLEGPFNYDENALKSRYYSEKYGDI